MPNPLQEDILNFGNRESDDSFIDLKVFKYKIGEMEKVFVGSHRKWNDILSQMNKKYNIEELHEKTVSLEKEIAARREALKEMSGEEAESTRRTIEKQEALYKEAYEKESRERTRASERATEILDTYEANLYKNSDLRQKVQIAQRKKDAIESTKVELKAKEELELAEAPLEEHARIRAEYAEKINALSEEEVKNNERLAKLSDAQLKARVEVAKKTRTASWAERRQMIADEKHKVTEEKTRKLESTIAERNLALDSASTDEEREEVIEKFAKAIAEAQEEVSKAQGEESTAKRNAGIAKAISKSLTNVLKSNLDAVEKGIESIKSLQSSIKARLQGAEANYEDILSLLSKNLAVSPYVSYQKSLDNLSKLVESGIAYNVEERSFLATISDKIATTFDAFDSNLMRIIRLQQADTTASRLAMEASLTKLFNNMFSDTSYLNDMYDTVQSAIVDASSALNYKESTAFEYILQKWLGSLYSLGMSDTAVSNIASGINMLATADRRLMENQPLTTLFAMSASRTPDVDFAEAFVNGLDSSQLNSLMKGMVQYLREIAENSDTNVIKAAYGDIFDMSFSDWTAILNLTNQDVENISKSVMTYESSLSELQNQFNEVSERMSVSEMISNVFSNLTFAQSANIASSSPLYALWEVANFIQSATGGIQFTNPGVLGNFLDLTAFTVEGIMKLGIIGLSSLPLITQIVDSINNRGGLGQENFFETWRARETTSRGTGLNLSSPVSTGTSTSAEYVGAGSSEEYATASLTQAMEDAAEQQKITNPEAETTKTFNDLFEALFGTTSGSGQQSLLVKIDQLDSLTQTVGTQNALISAFNNSPFLGDSDWLTASIEADKALRVWIVGSDIEMGGAPSSNTSNNVFGGNQSPSEITVDVLAQLLTFRDGDTEYTLSDLIKKLMDGELQSNVKITNPNFDTFLEKNIFMQ